MEDKAREKDHLYWAKIDGKWAPVKYLGEGEYYDEVSNSFNLDEKFLMIGNWYNCYVSNCGEAFEWGPACVKPV